jgi:hypothetical protein
MSEGKKKKLIPDPKLKINISCEEMFDLSSANPFMTEYLLKVDPNFKKYYNERNIQRQNKLDA